MSIRQKYIHPFFFFFYLFIYGFAQATDLPQSMVVLGDSISAGALAAYKRTDAHNPLAFPKFIKLLARAGYMRSIHAFEAPELSWATGMSKKIQSHATRLVALAKARKLSFKTHNAAVSGANSYDLEAQTAEVLHWSHENLDTSAPDYVLIAMGANDACVNDKKSAMTPVSDYAVNMRDSIEQLLAANPHSKILISGIPNVGHLRDTARNSFLGLPPLTFCKDVWRVHGFCQNLLLEKDASKRALIVDRINNYMKQVDLIKDDLNTRWGEDRVRFAPEVFSYNFSDKNISFDCFHPNTTGQQILSNVT